MSSERTSDRNANCTHIIAVKPGADFQHSNTKNEGRDHFMN